MENMSKNLPSDTHTHTYQLFNLNATQMLKILCRGLADTLFVDSGGNFQT